MISQYIRKKSEKNLQERTELLMFCKLSTLNFFDIYVYTFTYVSKKLYENSCIFTEAYNTLQNGKLKLHFFY